jgi:hypothetical protein
MWKKCSIGACYRSSRNAVWNVFIVPDFRKSFTRWACFLIWSCVYVWQNSIWNVPIVVLETCSVLGVEFGQCFGVILCRVWMLYIGMSETLCYGFHLGVIKRRSHMRWYVTIGEVNTLRLWSRYAVMLCLGELLGIPLMTRCVAIRCAERMWLGLGFSQCWRGVQSDEGLYFGVAFH